MSEADGIARLNRLPLNSSALAPVSARPAVGSLTPEQQAVYDRLLAEWDALPVNSSVLAPMAWTPDKPPDEWERRALEHWAARQALLLAALG